ncbi:hypothetical protein B0H16DRAFT_1527695 [Mycena metata]|uniref:Uncharacterized protein n=1 Tax=Mycena metata TaxID=1033252 RepID=A0AAD7NJV8_9AGAR|nr:hypothetical protein B0H16DRAFT_1527695 [Mycena metata]
MGVTRLSFRPWAGCCRGRGRWRLAPVVHLPDGVPVVDVRMVRSTPEDGDGRRRALYGYAQIGGMQRERDRVGTVQSLSRSLRGTLPLSVATRNDRRLLPFTPRTLRLPICPRRVRRLLGYRVGRDSGCTFCLDFHFLLFERAREGASPISLNFCLARWPADWASSYCAGVRWVYSVG